MNIIKAICLGVVVALSLQVTEASAMYGNSRMRVGYNGQVGPVHVGVTADHVIGLTILAGLAALAIAPGLYYYFTWYPNTPSRFIHRCNWLATLVDANDLAKYPLTFSNAEQLLLPWFSQTSPYYNAAMACQHILSEIDYLISHGKAILANSSYYSDSNYNMVSMRMNYLHEVRSVILRNLQFIKQNPTYAAELNAINTQQIAHAVTAASFRY